MPRGQRRGRGHGRRRQAHVPPATNQEISSWFAGNLPDDWFTEPPAIVFDRDEILVTGSIPQPRTTENQDPQLAAEARIEAFREETREHRMAIAERAQQKFLRTVSWAATCGGTTHAFTTATVPVMTRLSMHERSILDTLIDAGVARSRSDALAWCVQLVADNESDWLGRLRDAMKAVEEARSTGPDSAQ